MDLPLGKKNDMLHVTTVCLFKYDVRYSVWGGAKVYRLPMNQINSSTKYLKCCIRGWAFSKKSSVFFMWKWKISTFCLNDTFPLCPSECMLYESVRRAVFVSLPKKTNNLRRSEVKVHLYPVGAWLWHNGRTGVYSIPKFLLSRLTWWRPTKC